MQPIPWAQQSYQDASRDISVQRLVNMYLQPKAVQSKARTALHSTPGLTLWATIGDGPCRGIHGMGSYLYVVSGSALYRVDSAGASVLLGSITGNGPVGMANNGSHVVITTNVDEIYAADPTSLTTLSVSAADGVAYQDGYMLLVERYTQKFYISSLNDATTYDPLDFTLVNALPDLNVSIANLNRETWAFNQRSTQVYYNSGNADFPFARNPAGVVEKGCIASRSVAVYEGSVFWLGDDLRVYTNNGYRAAAISTPALENAISRLSSHASARGFVYSQLGHVFYVLTFPSQATYVFDVATNFWHERQSFDRNDWRALGHSFWFSKHLVGDAEDGSIYYLDTDAYTENGTTIRRVMTSPTLHGGRQRLFFGRLELDLENGIGIEGSGQGSDPEIMLRWSDDGGRTYSNELWRKLGKSGEYKWRTLWTSLGSSFERVYELSMSDPVKSVVIQAYHDIRGGGLR